MKAFIPSRETHTPLNSPSSAPTASVSAMATNGFERIVPGSHFVPARITSPGAKARIASIDRSNLPLISTKPCARTSMLMIVV